MRSTRSEGATFSRMPYRHIDDPATLRRLLDAVLLLEADLSLPVLLRHFVEEACSMTNARYGALGVLNDNRTALSEFITVGITEEQERAIAHRPTGLGVLGLLITDPKPLRIADISTHPHSAGFPEGHPHMSSFLGVPVVARDEVYGNLYLTEKVGCSEFTKDDENLVLAFAHAAGVVIASARLHLRVQEVALLEDRDRIARDLHDAVIQRLFAVGLSLQSLARPPLASETVERLGQAIADIDETIRQIRSSIFELAAESGRRSLRASVLALVRELRAVVGFDPSVTFEGPVDTEIPSDMAAHVLFTVRESLTNIGRHARATRASVKLSVAEDTCTLVVTDDGRGITGSSRRTSGGGLGMQNIRRRAERLGGDLVVSSPGGKGTTLTWRVPLPP